MDTVSAPCSPILAWSYPAFLMAHPKLAVAPVLTAFDTLCYDCPLIWQTPAESARRPTDGSHAPFHCAHLAHQSAHKRRSLLGPNDKTPEQISVNNVMSSSLSSKSFCLPRLVFAEYLSARTQCIYSRI